MRRLLGMLRDDDGGAELAPQPSLSRLDDLVAGCARSGPAASSCAIEGEPGRLPPGVDLRAYRIVQEALTNALKHAGRRGPR